MDAGYTINRRWGDDMWIAAFDGSPIGSSRTYNGAVSIIMKHNKEQTVG